MDDETLLILAAAGILLWTFRKPLADAASVASKAVGTVGTVVDTASSVVDASLTPGYVLTYPLSIIKSWGNPDAWFS